MRVRIQNKIIQCIIEDFNIKNIQNNIINCFMSFKEKQNNINKIKGFEIYFNYNNDIICIYRLDKQNKVINNYLNDQLIKDFNININDYLNKEAIIELEKLLMITLRGIKH